MLLGTVCKPVLSLYNTKQECFGLGCKVPYVTIELTQNNYLTLQVVEYRFSSETIQEWLIQTINHLSNSLQTKRVGIPKQHSRVLKGELDTCSQCGSWPNSKFLPGEESCSHVFDPAITTGFYPVGKFKPWLILSCQDSNGHFHHSIRACRLPQMTMASKTIRNEMLIDLFSHRLFLDLDRCVRPILWESGAKLCKSAIFWHFERQIRRFYLGFATSYEEEQKGPKTGLKSIKRVWIPGNANTAIFKLDLVNLPDSHDQEIIVRSCGKLMEIQAEMLSNFLRNYLRYHPTETVWGGDRLLRVVVELSGREDLLGGWKLVSKPLASNRGYEFVVARGKVTRLNKSEEA